MTKKIFRSIVLAAGSVLLASMVIIMGCLYGYFGGVQEAQLRDELGLAAVLTQDNGEAGLRQVDTRQFRLTWIAADGTVLYDTDADAETLENHAARAEVQQAMKDGEGESVRYSTTLLEKTMYCAKLLDDGTVLRISRSQATVGVLLLGMLQPFLVVLLAALLLAAVFAKRLSRRIVEPLNQLDLEHPLDNDAYDELSPLLGRISRQHQQIAAQMRELKRKTEEFAQITGSLQEGLVLLDERGYVLSINPAAQRLFATDGGCVGKDFLIVDRSREMDAAIGQAMSEGHSEMRAERGGRIWQFDISRIDTAGEKGGAALLAFDITERENAELSRREFTANVSHELKTPLQGIIGSAELIENGMVKEADMPRFIGHIRSEAQRLVTLIGDIIRLSQLDEGDEMPREQVDLLAVANEVQADLRGEAEQKQVRVQVDGGAAQISGVRRLLYEIVFNLCDNAIKYNREGGSVHVAVAKNGNFAAVTVADTGIGVAPEYQERIFERFYRVDKSHSKASGGTGLGLSIVKHAVAYHHGSIDLQSKPGQGTTITVTFPVAG